MNECRHASAHYTVKRMRLLKYLIDKGFSKYEVIPDPTNPKYNWFLFENSPALEMAIEAYFAELNAKRLEASKIH